MPTPRISYLAATAVLLPLGGAEGLSFHPEEQSVLEKEFTIDALVELDEISITVNGDDMSDNIPVDSVGVEATVRALISDEYRKVGDGRPLELVRVFEELSVEYDSGDDQGSESMDDLEGVSVLFQWDEEREDYDVSFTEDSEGADEDILKGLLEDMDFRALLPDGDVDEGGSWEVDTSGIVSVLFPGMRLDDLSRLAGEEADEVPEEILDQLGSIPGGLEMSCEYAGLREEDGVTVAVVELTLEGESSLDFATVIAEAVELGEAEADIENATVEFSLEGAGQLLWNLEEGHMVAYSMEAELEVELVVSASVDVQGSSLDVEGDVLFLGEVTWEAGLEGE